MHSDTEQTEPNEQGTRNGSSFKNLIATTITLALLPAVMLLLQQAGLIRFATASQPVYTLTIDLLFDSASIALASACTLFIFANRNRKQLLMQMIAFACIGWSLLDGLQIWLALQIASGDNANSSTEIINYLNLIWQTNRFFESLLLLTLLATFFWLKGHKQQFRQISQPSVLIWGVFLSAFFVFAAHSVIHTHEPAQNTLNNSLINAWQDGGVNIITLMPLTAFSLLTLLLFQLHRTHQKNASIAHKISRAHSQSVSKTTQLTDERSRWAVMLTGYLMAPALVNVLAEIMFITSFSLTNSQLVISHYLEVLGLAILLFGLINCQSVNTLSTHNSPIATEPHTETNLSDTHTPSAKAHSSTSTSTSSKPTAGPNTQFNEESLMNSAGERPKHWRWPLRLKLPIAGLCLGIIMALSSSIVFYSVTKTLLNEEAHSAENQKMRAMKNSIHNYFDYHTQLLLQLSQSPSIINLTDGSGTADSTLVNFIAELIAREPSIQAISVLSTKTTPALQLQVKRLPSGRIVQSSLPIQAPLSGKLSMETPLLIQTLKSSTDTVWHQSQRGDLSTLDQNNLILEQLSTPITAKHSRQGVIHMVFSTLPLFENILPQHSVRAEISRHEGHDRNPAHRNHEPHQQSEALLTQTLLTLSRPVSQPVISAKIGKVVLKPRQRTPYGINHLQQKLNATQRQKDGTLTLDVTLAIDPKSLAPTHAFNIALAPTDISSALFYHFISSLLIGLSLSILAFIFSVFATQHFLSPIFNLIKSLRTSTKIQSIPDFNYDTDEGHLLTLAIAALEEQKSSADADNTKLALNLEKTYQQLDISEHFKNNFLTSMSHEVRTPLNGVLGMLDLVRRNTLTEDQHHQIDLAYTSAQALLKIINDIIDYSDIETNRLTLSYIDFDLEDLLDQIQAEFEPIAEQKRLAFSIQTESPCGFNVSGDPVRIGQILSQLIANAIKFTDEGSVLVSIKLREEGDIGRRLFCSVLDTGMGITPNQTNNLFEAFTQIDNSMTRSQGGIGLGLTITKQLCQLMHGNISVESERGKGSRFSFDVLLRVSACDRSTTLMHIKSPHTAEHNGRKGAHNRVLNKGPGDHRVLIVEDDPISYQLLQDLLQEININSEVVTDGQDAIEKLNRTEHVHLYDIILMDCELPNLSGYDATRRIRAGLCGPGYKHTPIIAITSNALTGDREKCLDAGMSDYLAKPIEPDSFLNLIRQWLAIAKQQAQIDLLTHQTTDGSNITEISAKRDSQ